MDLVERTLYFLRSLQAPIKALVGSCPGHTWERRRQVLHRLQAATVFLAGNLQCTFSLSTLASMCHMSPWYFTKVFKTVYGIGPREMTAAMRVELAAMLLDQTPQSIGEIAYRCGFRSPSTFARAFKRSFGLSAMAYRCRPDVRSLAKPGQLFQVAIEKQPLR